MENSTEVIGAIGVSIVTPIVAYLKVRSETAKRGEKRDTQFALLDQRVKECEKKGDSVEELKIAIGRINVTLAKLETLMQMFVKHLDKRDEK